MRAKLPHTTGKVNSNGINLYYEIYGKGEQTILFIPTWSLVHSRAYKAQIPYFSDRYRCIAWDPRGNGKSDHPTDPQQYRLKDYVDDAIAIMDATDTKTSIIFGWSLSTISVAALASFYPDRIDAAIMIASNSPLESPENFGNYDNFLSDLDSFEGWNKFNKQYWQTNFEDFYNFFIRRIANEEHSTKQIEDGLNWASGTNEKVLIATMETNDPEDLILNESDYRKIKCPVLIIHGENDALTPCAVAENIAELTSAELHVIADAGHMPHGRFPAKVNTIMRNFLAENLEAYKPLLLKRKGKGKSKNVLYLSSPIGLGHGRRDLAITQELRKQHPDLQVDWLAQDPVTRFLKANDERVHPASVKLANESLHIESEAGEHDLNAFQAIRNMDEILIANFMVFQEVLEQEHYDLVIADEAWDVDHYWHEHPELKKAQVAWLTDFVGWVPMPDNGAHEAFLTTDYNAEMIGHVENNPQVRDRSIFVGNPNDIIPHGFGADLPEMRTWIPEHFDFCGYILGQHPSGFGERAELRNRFGYQEGEKVCIVTVGGSGVGGTLIKRILDSYPIAKRHIPDLRMIVVTGPRLDPERFDFPLGVEAKSFVPDLDQHLAACDLALVQGGLTTTMELAAAGTPFLYFPLKNHFEQNFHVAHRLDQYKAGRKMIFSESNPDVIAAAMVEEINNDVPYLAVESHGARTAATMLAELL